MNKKRLTHNQSMTHNRGSGTSVNGWVLWGDLQECRYGYCFFRTIHAIACLLHSHPWSRIFLAKFDFKSAYQRHHYHWKTPIQCITVHSNLAYLAPWLTFGGVPCPSEWGNIWNPFSALPTFTWWTLNGHQTKCTPQPNVPLPHYPLSIRPNTHPLASFCLPLNLPKIHRNSLNLSFIFPLMTACTFLKAHTRATPPLLWVKTPTLYM